MKKWLLGILAAIGGILAIILGIGKKKRVNELNKQIRDVNKSLKNKEKQSDAFNKTLESKKEALKEIKNKKYDKKDIGAKEASDFLKDFSKGKK